MIINKDINNILLFDIYLYEYSHIVWVGLSLVAGGVIVERSTKVGFITEDSFEVNVCIFSDNSVIHCSSFVIRIKIRSNEDILFI